MNGERFFLTVRLPVDKYGGTVGFGKSLFAAIAVKTG